MFSVIADTIEFNGRAVARLTIPEGSLRDSIVDALDCYDPDILESLNERLADLKEELDHAESRADAWQADCEALQRRLDALKLGASKPKPPRR